MDDFFNNHSAEIFTLLGAIVGAVSTILAQLITGRVMRDESIRKERSKVATELYSLYSKLFSDLININSIIGYHNAEKKDLQHYFKQTEASMSNFSNYYTEKAIYIPEKAKKHCDTFHKTAIELMIATGSSIRSIAPPNTISGDAAMKSFERRKSEWVTRFSDLSSKKDAFSKVLRKINEGKIR